MTEFVRRDSVVRRIWGDADMVLLIFAGSAAEFALNRAVDWLFFTGKLPADPIGRLFATAGYAQHIVFADTVTATGTLERIRAAHVAVERERGQRIPDWAHRDVLYMLIAYSERAHELFVGPLSAAERDDLYDVFYRVGTGLGVRDLPTTYREWRIDREEHLRRDLVRTGTSEELYRRYRLHLGWWRYRLLLWIQAAIVHRHVREQLRLRSGAWLRPLVRLYPVLVRLGFRGLIQWVLLPAEHVSAVRALDEQNFRASAMAESVG